MAAEDRHTVTSHASDRSQVIGRLCEQFESGWQGGEPPRLEDLLGQVRADERGDLLRALLRVELSYRAGQGQAPLPAEYQARFPDHADCVAAAFNQVLPAILQSSRSSSANDTVGGPQMSPNLANEAEAVPSRIGRYLTRRQIGRGAFGTVWLAQDEELQRQVAIKVPRREWLSTSEGLTAFLREARIVAGLRHPGIVTVYDVGRLDDEGCFVVMEYVDGRSLAEEIKAARPSFQRSADLIEQVATAVHHAHKHGLVHRDLKPANILLDSAGRPYVADFGLALREEEFSRLWHNAGTPAYMSPEQARGEGHLVDGRSDIYSLGVVLFELLVGRRPYRQSTLPKLLDEIATVEVRPPRQLNDSIPKELDRICLKALAKRVADRYSTAQDLADDLRHWLSAERQGEAPGITLPHDRSQTPALGSARSASTKVATGMVVGQDASAKEMSATVASVAPRIVPKGLRSFDAHDADFFLQLLPGPTDRDGLPESLRFWKAQIEETDADRTFRVGLIYGPSGCGKSSLVKAGLLPRLANQVQHLYLEATSDDTESRLAKSLQKSFPELPAGSLVEALAALRRGAVPGAPPKLLLVLDQFEQWLHARLDEPGAELVRALRQCDGGRVQCLVLVRDDFWMAATRFMRELDLRLVERQNSAGVDLFDPEHARRVLFEFGRAFGRLPNSADELTADQERFLREALAGLVEDGKLVPVRLALFAEMVKGKPWTSDTLQSLGGIKGVGVTFLEEMFSASTAPPAHRLYERAARAVLTALLPEPGSDIKGRKHSRNELLAASGYAARPADFDELLQILDGELRLITPSDADVLGESSLARVTPSERRYQLTHDYLVPSLRDWLTRKQRETRRGRAQLRLAERAAAFQARPDPRQLPGWWEWANIVLCTRWSKWTPSECMMMRSANRRRLVQVTIAVVLVALTIFSGFELRRRTIADAGVQRLLVAPMQSVPAIVAELQPYKRYSDAKLRAVLAPHSRVTDAERLRAAVGLISDDPAQVQRVYKTLLSAPADEARVLIAVLEAYRNDLTEPLWARVSDSATQPASRLRAAMALAAYDPPANAQAGGHWQANASFVTDAMLSEARQDPSQYESLVASLQPAEGVLRKPLTRVFHDDQRNTTERELATTILARYTLSEPSALVELVCTSQPAQFQLLFPVLQKLGHLAIAPLVAELERRAAPADDSEKEPIALRQANAAIALLRLNEGTQVWPLLAHSPDPRLRTWLVHRFAPLGVEPKILAERLFARPESHNDEGPTSPAEVLLFEREASIRRALLLALGEYDAAALPETERNRLLPGVIELYQSDPDPGVHGAAAWLARRWGEVELAEADVKAARVQGSDVAKRWYINRQGQTMVVVSAPAEFLMGSPADEPGHLLDEPIHRRQIGRSYAISAHEVTIGQLKRFRPDFPYDPQLAPATTCPAYSVSWYEAAAYCNWLSEQEGLDRRQWCYEPNRNGQYAAGMRPAANNVARQGYRLPTEAEWEFACRAGTVTSRFYGDNESLLGEYAWYLDNSKMRGFAPVGTLKPNDLGLFDILGNSYEWCGEPTMPYPSIAVDDAAGENGNAAPVVDNTFFQLRGGAYDAGAHRLRSANRGGNQAVNTHVSNGFRVAQTVPLDESQSLDAADRLTASSAGEGTATESVKRRTNSLGMTLVRVPAGEFEMGSGAQDIEHWREQTKAEYYGDAFAASLQAEQPRHRVRITRPFELSAHEVTVAQFCAFVDDSGYRTEAETDGTDGWKLENGKWVQTPTFTWWEPGFSQADELPVVHVTWNDAAAFCYWLSEQEHRNYRLPTEAEWEYACRAGTRTAFCFGPIVLPGDARFASTAPVAVGSYQPNAFGLYDMHGNVWEWCADWFSSDDYQKSVTDDPSGPATGSSRALRGGCWSDGGLYLRSACRYGQVPSQHNWTFGFRVLCEAEDETAVADSPANQPLEDPGSNGSSASVATAQRQFGRFRFNLGRGRLDELIADYDAALAVKPDNVGWVVQRGMLLARCGRWIEARDAFRCADELAPGDPSAWYCAAMLDSFLDDSEAYKNLCGRLVMRFQNTGDLFLAERTAKICSLRSDGPRDRTAILRLADFAVANGANHTWRHYFQTAKALAELRDGRWDRALESVARSFEITNGQGPPDLMVLNNLIAALAHHGAGRSDQAAVHYAVAQELFAKHVPKLEGGDLPNWINWLCCEIVRREAEKTIQRVKP